ncbi:MAG: hypothetical protein EOP62_14915 [Sphingomonadales bacterium]|nr:MAG: hypothetical protein EOP62_14915 [Sphingomonadales bacterium]
MRALSLLIIAAATLSGCAGGSAFNDRPAALTYRTLSSANPPSLLNPIETEEIILKRYDGTDADRGGLGRTAYRDKVVRRYLAADEDTFNAFIRALRTQRVGLNLGTDGALILLNGISAVTGGAKTKSALAAISGGIIGARNSVDKELFNLEAISAIISKMRATRLTALVPITAGLAKPDSQYTLEEALIDLRAYAGAGTLTSAWAAVHEDAGAETQQAQGELKAITHDAADRDSVTLRDSLRARLVALTDPQVVKLANILQPKIANRSGDVQQHLLAILPAGSGPATIFTNAAPARQYMGFWLLQDDTALLKQWEDALTEAEK